MKSCHRYRESLSLLALDVLPPAERDEVEQHLAECGACREHFHELSTTANVFVASDQRLPDVRPSARQSARWARDIRTAAQRSKAPAFSESRWARAWRSLWMQQRPALCGLAAVWALTFVLRVAGPSLPETQSVASAPPRTLLATLRAMRSHPNHFVQAEVSDQERRRPAQPRPRSDRGRPQRTSRYHA